MLRLPLDTFTQAARYDRCVKSDRNHPLPQAPAVVHPGLPALISAAVAFLLYVVTLHGTYVYDDLNIVRDDPRLHHPGQWVQLWTTDYFNGGADNLYRPLISSSYAIEWYLHGDRPWVFHLVNILLHALVSAGVAEFTRRVCAASSRAFSAALCAGLLFAVHPVHVEAVSNIVGRAELACTAGIVAALILLAGKPLTTGRAIAVVGVAMIAVLCKEQGVLQPLLWLFFGLSFWRFAGAPDIERRHLQIFILITCWTWACYLIGRERLLKFEWDRSFLDFSVQPMVLSTGLDRVLMPVVLLGRYTALLVWPAHLSPDYSGEVIGHIVRYADPFLWLGFFSIITWVTAACWSIITRRHVVTFCLLCLAATYGMIGNIITLIGTIFAERLLYLPSVFFVMLVGIMLACVPIKPRVILMSIAVALGGFSSFTAARDWNHPMTLFQKALASHPDAFQLHLLIAQEYHTQGNDSAAEQVMSSATARFPNYWQAWMHRADREMDAGNLDQAAKCLQIAQKIEASPLLLAPESRLAGLQAAKQAGSRPATMR